MAKASKKEVVSVPGYMSEANWELQKELSTHKVGKLNLSSFVRLSETMEELANHPRTSTGFPSLDQLYDTAGGNGPVDGKDTELYSRNAQSGKSSLALQIGAAYQLQGKRVAVIDPEGGNDDLFCNRLGLITHPGPESNLVAPVFLRHEDVEGGFMTAEFILDIAGILMDVMDLVIIDSVASMVPASETVKEMTDNPKMSEIAAILSRYMKQHTKKRAHCIWVNQMRSANFGGQGPTMVTPGGKATEFYSTYRIELAMVEKLRIKDDADPYGMKVKAFTVKNKIGTPFRSATLKYVFGDGFSDILDYLEAAVAIEAVEKSGSWYSFGGERIGQGVVKTYEFLREHPEIMVAIRKAVDGDDVVEEPAA